MTRTTIRAPSLPSRRHSPALGPAALASPPNPDLAGLFPRPPYRAISYPKSWLIWRPKSALTTALFPRFGPGQNASGVVSPQKFERERSNPSPTIIPLLTSNSGQEFPEMGHFWPKMTQIWPESDQILADLGQNLAARPDLGRLSGRRPEKACKNLARFLTKNLTAISDSTRKIQL